MRSLPASTSICLALVALVACDTDFAAPSRVDGLRVLAVRAEPPEVAPGERARFEALVVGAPLDEARFVWRACLVRQAGDPGGGFDGFGLPGPGTVPDPGVSDCAGAVAQRLPYARELGQGRAAELEVPAGFLADDTALTAAYDLAGVTLTEAGRSELLEVAGVPYRVELTLTHPSLAAPLVAAKVVRVSLAAVKNANPPAPRYEITPRPLAAGARHVLTLEDLPAEPEPYDVLVPVSIRDAFERVSRSETWAYSFFSTRGAFDEDAVKVLAGSAAVGWRLAPDERGPGDLWVVVRDGRGGLAWSAESLAIE